MTKALPYRRGGGRPITLPNCEAGRTICQDINELVAKKTPLGVAHERIAERRNMAVRNIERIWSLRDRYLSDECNDDEIIKLVSSGLPPVSADDKP